MERPHFPLREADEDNLVRIVQSVRQLLEIGVAFALLPHTGHAQENVFVLEAQPFPQALVHRAESAKVDAVWNHLHRILPQIGLPRVARQPPGGRHHRQIRRSGKGLFLSLVIPGRVIPKQRVRVDVPVLGAVPAARLPFHAADIVEMGAVAREAPAVVKRPDHRLPRSL